MNCRRMGAYIWSYMEKRLLLWPLFSHPRSALFTPMYSHPNVLYFNNARTLLPEKDGCLEFSRICELALLEFVCVCVCAHTHMWWSKVEKVLFGTPVISRLVKTQCLGPSLCSSCKVRMQHHIHDKASGDTQCDIKIRSQRNTPWHLKFGKSPADILRSQVFTPQRTKAQLERSVSGGGEQEDSPFWTQPFPLSLWAPSPEPDHVFLGWPWTNSLCLRECHPLEPDRLCSRDD